MNDMWDDQPYLREEQQEGLYVAAFFSEQTQQLIAQWQARHNIPNPVPTPSLHTTIVYSKVPVPGFEANHTVEVPVNTTYSRLEVWDTQGGTKCLVWQFFSPYLHVRFQEAMAAGATYDFDEYKPHVTLSYDVGDLDVSSLPHPGFPLVIAGEYSETIDLGIA